VSVFEQVIIFSLIITLGVMLGFIFDFYRTLRQIWCPGYWGTSLGDVVFWIIVTAFSYLFLILVTWGEVRLYVFIAITIGVALYLKFFSRTARKFMYRMYCCIKTIVLRLYRQFRAALRCIGKIFNWFKHNKSLPKG